MRIAQRFGLAALLLAIVLGAAALGAFASIDRLLADARFKLLSKPASGQVVFVDIDSASLAEVGVWPWPRDIHARVLDRLMELGAAEVAFDIDFSARSNPASDAALATALEAAGGYAMLAAFEQVDGATGERRLTVPLPDLAAHASTVAVNVTAGPEGLIDSIPAETQGLPAMPVALSGARAPAQIHLDYGIDLTTVDRIPVRELLAGTVDPARIADRQVVIGASAIELRDIFSVPRFGMLPGPLVQIAGVETLKAGRSLTPLGQWPGTIAALLFGALWVLVGSRIRMRHAIASAVGAIAGALVLSFPLQGLFGVTMQLGGFVFALMVLLGLHIALGFGVEFAQRRRAEPELVKLARQDAVTGLPSRLGFLEQIDAAAAGPILLVGLQRLDLVRGTLGREVIDATLRQVAERFAALGTGGLALVDRDVFAVALPADATNADLDDLGRELRRTLRAMFAVDGHEVHVDAVLAAALPEVGVSTDLRLRRAELALQSALGDPGSGVVRFAPEMEDVVARRRRIDTALRQAIDRRELTVVFQPQARADDGTLVGVEALVRWTSPELGPVSPAEFIPLAEETGLIVPLGRFVLTEACRAAQSWDWDGRLAVNLSATQLRLSDVAEMIADGLTETGFDPRRLDVEITESVLVDGPDKIARTFEQVRALGIGIAIDDFGTGYSSLSYLSQLSFDKLKIDQSFVRRLGESAAEDAIVRTVIELAQRLGKTTVAEGVETEAQRAQLAGMGCDICQGWLIGKPVPAAEIAARIEKTRGLRLSCPGSHPNPGVGRGPC